MIAIVSLVAASASILGLFGIIKFLLAREGLANLLHLRGISLLIRLQRRIAICIHLDFLPKDV